jgi:flap endonuclease-1
MGIKNLLKFLYNFSDIVKIKQASDFYNKRIAIDISILLYQSVISIRNSGQDIKNKDGYVISHVLGLLNKILNLLEYGILPVFVFDGKPPSIKKKLLNLRKELKNKAYEKYEQSSQNIDKIKFFKRCVNISKEQIDDCRELLDLMGLPYINAPEEADSVLASLSRNNLVYAVLTEDMDILTFGAKRIIRNFISYNKPIIQIDLEDIIKTLNITQEQFIDLCIYFGCDYCQIINTNNLSHIEIYDIHIKNNQMLNSLMVFDINEVTNAKNYFIKHYNDNTLYTIEFKPPNIDKLIELLKTKYCFTSNNARYKVMRLFNYYKRYIQNKN